MALTVEVSWLHDWRDPLTVMFCGFAAQSVMKGYHVASLMLSTMTVLECQSYHVSELNISTPPPASYQALKLSSFRITKSSS